LFVRGRSIKFDLTLSSRIMARHRRLQKKNRKKLKSVDPFNFGKNSIRETKALSKNNIAPNLDELDAQPMSKSSRDLAELILSSAKTFPVKNKKRPRNRLIEETEKAGFVRRRYENEAQFMRRVGNLTHHLVQEEFMKVKYEIAGRDVKELAADLKELDEKAKRRKEQKAARREKLFRARQQEVGEHQHFQKEHHDESLGSNSKGDNEQKPAKKSRLSLKDRKKRLKREQEEDDAADLMLNAREVIAFGERVDAPPEFSQQCKFKQKNRVGEKKLLLNALFHPKSNGIDPTVESPKSGPKQGNEAERLQVIEAYRQLKRQRRNLPAN